MKDYLIAILTCLTLIGEVSAQADKRQISRIDKSRLKIRNNLAGFQKNEQKLNDSTITEYAYAEGKELELVTVYVNDKTIIKNVEWYFLDKHLIYSEQIWTDPSTKNIVDKEKFYLENGHLIAWIKSNNIGVDNTSQAFKQCETKLIAYGEKLENDYNNRLKANKK